ncbi:MAG: chloride channel protein [Coprococcus sp.]
MEFTKEYWINCFKRSLRYGRIFIKWILFALIMGTTCGAVGSAFHLCVEYVTGFREENNWIISFLPLAGLLIVFIYRICGIKHDKGTNLVIGSVRSSDDIVPSRMAPLIFITTVITHLFGGSSGREGAALQIGGSLGVSIGKIFKLDESDKHILTLCGMSAVFAALFGTPISAALFSMEVISIGILYYCAFVPCVLSSTIAFVITQKLNITHTYFTIDIIPKFGIATVIRVIALAILCAILSSLFCLAMHIVSKLFRRFFKNQYIRVFVGGLILVALTFLLRTTDYNGAGMDIIGKAISGDARPEAFLLKILFTCITIGCGFRGGEIVPSFFIGATFGCITGGIMGLDPGFAAAMGLICFFCGAVNCPLTSLFLSLELFGSEGILLFTIGCSVSYMLSGYYSLYNEQKIIYSKLRPHYVNLYTNQEVKTAEENK